MVLPLRTLDKSRYGFDHYGFISIFLFSSIFPTVSIVAGMSSSFVLSVSMNLLTVRGAHSNVSLPSARRTPGVVPLSVV